MKSLAVLLILAQAAVAAPTPSGSRIKELAALEGVRDNQLVGYGLVVGLAGTGDKRQTVFSAQSLANLLQRMGVSVNPTAMQVRNTAAVMVTATLPPFAQTGGKIDITAAAIGDATNLAGGILVMTPLKGPDGQTYAVAQGALVTGGFIAGRRGGNSTTVNHPTTARIPDGAIVEKASPSPVPTEKLKLQLRNTDFTTAARIAAAINRQFASEGQVAHADTPATVSITVPSSYRTRMVEFMAEVEGLPVESDRKLKVVVNERTGTIVLGKEARIAPTSILHGNMTVEIQTTPQVSQPAPLSSGKTTVTPQTNVTAKEERAKEITLQAGATVEDLVRALVASGATPRDIIVILQNLKANGALDAELEVI